MLFIIIGHLIQVFGKAYGSLASYMNREKHMVLTGSAFKAESSHRKVLVTLLCKVITIVSIWKQIKIKWIT